MSVKRYAKAVDKPALRRRARALLAGADLAAVARASLPALAELLAGRRRVLLYAPLPDELDPTPLRERLEAELFLPKVAGSSLLVLPWEGPLARGAFGVREPRGGRPLPPEALEAVVVPALAYDHAGYRLGRGKGYYDRFLKALPPAVLTIGWVPEAVRFPELPRDPWDVPVRAVVTEKGVFPAP